MDLFEPGTGSQVHDNNGGIQLSGLFWTVQLPDGSFEMSEDGESAHLHDAKVPLLDQFQFMGPDTIPSTVSLDVRWTAAGPRVRRGSGRSVAPTDGAAFLGDFAPARSTASFSGTELGFSFRSDPGATSYPRGFSEMGDERNGVFM